MRILLVEDHKDLRELMKSLLKEHGGWDVCGEAVNGFEAVTLADELKPDLIIMDLSMPKMDGLQASALVSATMPHVPILLYTNYSLVPEVVEQAKKAGVWEVLTKGNAKELLRVVQQLRAQAVARATEKTARAAEGTALTDGDLALEPEGT